MLFQIRHAEGFWRQYVIHVIPAESHLYWYQQYIPAILSAFSMDFYITVWMIDTVVSLSKYVSVFSFSHFTSMIAAFNKVVNFTRFYSLSPFNLKEERPILKGNIHCPLAKWIDSSAYKVLTINFLRRVGWARTRPIVGVTVLWRDPQGEQASATSRDMYTRYKCV